jgi:hypothetical protein
MSNWPKTWMPSPATRPHNQLQRLHHDWHFSPSPRCRRDRILLGRRARRDCAFGGAQPATDRELGHPAGRMMPRPPDARTVTWFKAHVPELQAKLAACKDNPGGARNDAECDNAQHAQWDLSFDAFLGKSK